jgi:hypothetical protein
MADPKAARPQWMLAAQLIGTARSVGCRPSTDRLSIRTWDTPRPAPHVHFFDLIRSTVCGHSPLE